MLLVLRPDYQPGQSHRCAVLLDVLHVIIRHQPSELLHVLVPGKEARVADGAEVGDHEAVRSPVISILRVTLMVRDLRHLSQPVVVQGQPVDLVVDLVAVGQRIEELTELSRLPDPDLLPILVHVVPVLILLELGRLHRTLLDRRVDVVAPGFHRPDADRHAFHRGHIRAVHTIPPRVGRVAAIELLECRERLVAVLEVVVVHVPGTHERQVPAQAFHLVAGDHLRVGIEEDLSLSVNCADILLVVTARAAVHHVPVVVRIVQVVVVAPVGQQCRALQVGRVELRALFAEDGVVLQRGRRDAPLLRVLRVGQIDGECLAHHLRVELLVLLEQLLGLVDPVLHLRPRCLELCVHIVDFVLMMVADVVERLVVFLLLVGAEDVLDVIGEIGFGCSFPGSRHGALASILTLWDTFLS
ncbi:hypothetical protein N7449_007833 [Penicillium cf. viridicatum]|uniref:Uncharacterized protein n=1 Tax=Penicillium cf. viridicatum TaxID=2972119 RepID=A0A9W9JI48_9EURO|nr:hypothetical protein N7449_007833 [Penicillium cf. viridicatum]